ncbi:hypothetical protein BU16DRAFT_525336 [Lophium mytilinum]|uniref:Alkaline phytoceramidase n=1 Tax=Lophium mytilinum TaxID=390894 RepID=A0A6A6R2V8_9PEZI|nr:hypothetical protein BU16DRAFT_525336 [Lophium mytilinum]
MHIFASALFYYSLSPFLPASRRRILASLTLLLETINTLNFITSKNTFLHQISFVSMLAFVTVLLMVRVERVRANKLKQRLRRLYMTGILLFLVGYALWQLDFHTCASMRELRHRIGMPMSWVFELHGWWHVCTAVAGYNYIQTIEALDENAKRGGREEGVRERKNSRSGLEDGMQPMSMALPRGFV